MNRGSLELKRQVIFPADISLVNLRQGFIDKPAVVVGSKLAAQQLGGDLRRQVGCLIPDLLEGLVASGGNLALQAFAVGLDFVSCLGYQFIAHALGVAPSPVYEVTHILLGPVHSRLKFGLRALGFRMQSLRICNGALDSLFPLV